MNEYDMEIEKFTKDFIENFIGEVSNEEETKIKEYFYINVKKINKSNDYKPFTLKSTIVSDSKLSKKNTSESSKKDLSSYQYFMRIMKKKYTVMNIKLSQDLFSLAWKQVSDENKKLFSEGAKNITDEHEKTLYDIVPIVESENIYTYSNYLAIKKQLKLTNQNETFKKWSELNKDQQISFIDNYQNLLNK